MTKEALLEKIESLPPEKQVEVEDFVDFLAARTQTDADRATIRTFPDELLDRIRARRERLFREHGYFDTLPIIRDLRENGPR